jgi:hypothetical protein
MVGGGVTCGIHFLLTKLVASIVFKPVLDNRSISSVLTWVGTRNFSFCRPSRGETSTIRTDILRNKKRGGEDKGKVEKRKEAKVRGEKGMKPLAREEKRGMTLLIIGGLVMVVVVFKEAKSPPPNPDERSGVLRTDSVGQRRRLGITGN